MLFHYYSGFLHQFKWKLTAAAISQKRSSRPNNIEYLSDILRVMSLCNSSTSQVMLKKKMGPRRRRRGDRSKNTAGKTLIHYYTTLRKCGREKVGSGNTLKPSRRRSCKVCKSVVCCSHRSPMVRFMGFCLRIFFIRLRHLLVRVGNTTDDRAKLIPIRIVA